MVASVWLFQVLLGLLLGLCVGSLVANLARSWPDGLERLVRGRSCCAGCGRTLEAVDLVPVASWLVLHGRCRHCGAPVAAFYTIVELTAGGIGVAALALLAPPAGWLAALVGWTLLAMTLVDLEHLVLPDLLTLPLLAAGLAAALAGPFLAGPDLVADVWPGPGPIEALAGAGIGWAGLWTVRALYRRLRGREGLGLGDVKLFAAAGAWCGAEGLVWVLLAGATGGLLFGLGRGIGLRSTRPVPFGPALAAAFWLVMLVRWSPLPLP